MARKIVETLDNWSDIDGKTVAEMAEFFRQLSQKWGGTARVNFDYQDEAVYNYGGGRDSVETCAVITVSVED